MDICAIAVGFRAFRHDFQRSAEIRYGSEEIAGILSRKTTLEIGRSVVRSKLKSNAVCLYCSIQIARACQLIPQFNVGCSGSMRRLSGDKFRRHYDVTTDTQKHSAHSN